MRARNPKIFHPNRVKRDSALPPSDDKSLATLLKEHDEAKILPFHMPGHKRAPFDFLFGAQKLDITEIEGFDNLHDASGVLKTASERAAALYGVKYSRFLIDGSTCGILAGIRAVTNAGDKILVARNCHKSVFNAIELCSLTPVYVRPTFFEEYGFYGSVLPGDVQAAFDQNPDIRLVVITSPTYEGVISDVQKLRIYATLTARFCLLTKRTARIWDLTESLKKAQDNSARTSWSTAFTRLCQALRKPRCCML